jgi:hypothetical protein
MLRQLVGILLGAAGGIVYLLVFAFVGMSSNNMFEGIIVLAVAATLINSVLYLYKTPGHYWWRPCSVSLPCFLGTVGQGISFIAESFAIGFLVVFAIGLLLMIVSRSR